MEKTVGAFKGNTSDPYPCWCKITDDQGNEIRFSHKDICDLEHLVKEMKKDVVAVLSETKWGCEAV